MNYAVISTDATLRSAVAEALETGRTNLKLVTTLAAPLHTLGREVAAELQRAAVQGVVLDVTEDPALGMRFAKFLSDEIPGISFVLVGPADVPPALLLEAMRVGATEYIKTPYEFAELAAALGRAARRLGGTPAIAPADTREPGRVFTFYSGKGGVGVSTTAVNFAVWLQHATHSSTILVDLDVELGSAALLLGITPRYSFADVVRNQHRMDQNLLESLVDHHPSGVDLIASPAQPNGSEGFTKEQVRAVIQLLRRHYDNVVIDVARGPNAVTLTALERSDDIMLVTTPDLPALRNTKKVLPLVQRAAPGGTGSIRVILNRTSPTDLIQASDVQEALGLDVFCSLSSDEENLVASANEGRPAIDRPKSKYARDVHALVAQLVATTNGKAPTTGLASLLRPFRRAGKE